VSIHGIKKRAGGRVDGQSGSAAAMSAGYSLPSRFAFESVRYVFGCRFYWGL